MSIARHHRHGTRHAGGAAQNDMRQAFERLFESPFFAHDGDDSSVATAQWRPRVDIREEDGRFVILADLPGIDPREIEVSMDKGILTIRGERRQEATEQARYSRVERRHGSFHRRFALPDSADAERVSARGVHGTLEVVIPKRPESAPRRIEVGTGTIQDEPTVQ